MNEVVVMCVAIGRALFEFDTDTVTRRMADIKVTVNF